MSPKKEVIPSITSTDQHYFKLILLCLFGLILQNSPSWKHGELCTLLHISALRNASLESPKCPLYVLEDLSLAVCKGLKISRFRNVLYRGEICVTGSQEAVILFITTFKMEK